MSCREVEAQLASVEKKSLCDRGCPECPVMLLAEIIATYRSRTHTEHTLTVSFPEGTAMPGDYCSDKELTDQITFGFHTDRFYPEEGDNRIKGSFAVIECLDDEGFQKGVFYIAKKDIMATLPPNIKISDNKIYAAVIIENKAWGVSKDNIIWRYVDPLTGALQTDSFQNCGKRINTADLNLARMESGRTPLTPEMVKLIENALIK